VIARAKGSSGEGDDARRKTVSACDSISVVMPTYNRADALRRNLHSVLGLESVDQVIVVIDGSTDDTDDVLQSFADPHLRVVRHVANRGVAAARNTGIQTSRARWVLFAEDDCRFPADYALVLRDVAEQHGAALVGAPLLYVSGDDHVAHRAATNARRVDRPSIEAVGVFPTRAIETPFVPARVLVLRSVFDHVRFDERYGGNAYREETDLFVQAARAGYRCLFTPATYCWQVDVWGGGTHESRGLRYEYWALRNNWRFLRRHGNWLAKRGYIASPGRAQFRFTARRAYNFIWGALRARVERRQRARVT
jgi:GT2 family glycosyltransferase